MHIDYFVRHLFGQIHYIGMVKGKDDPIFKNLFEWISLLNSNKRKRKSQNSSSVQVALDLDTQIELFLATFNLSTDNLDM
jgi:hypothetical protein